MEVGRDTVVRFHYELSDESGKRLESSRDGDGLAVLYGHGNVIPGLDDSLAGRSAGERFQVTVPPERGYGVRREGWTQRVSKKYLPRGRKHKAGDVVRLRFQGGPREVTILKVGGSVVDVDLNHPLAGHTLVFDIEVLEVRAARPDEIAHGHAHDIGGHSHG